MDDESSLTPANPAFELPHLCRCSFELSPQPMVAVEGTTSIVRHVNAAFLRLAGANRSDLIGRPFAQAVPEGKANECTSLLDRVYRTGRPECLAEQKHGGAPPVYWSYAVWAILEGEGRSDEPPVGVMIQVTDSTETAVFRGQALAMNESLLLSGIRQHELMETSEALNARLESAIMGKEYFIAVLSHELRTPLAPVLLAVSMLQQDQRLEPDTREIMQMIHRNVNLEARLIDDLLDMTRIERGTLNLDRCPVDLRGVLERAVEECRADLEAGGLTLEADTGGGPQLVEADAGRLQQVFSNLLRNAIKFTPAGGRVKVRSRRDGDSCAVEVSDSGAGMDAEFLPRAFSAFEQGDKTYTRKSGLGLGLAICKTIVDLHGGSITAQSEGRGRGATFVVRLPGLVGVRSVQAEKGPTAPDGPCPVKQLRILLVEDHADTARFMRRLLTLDGHAVQWAGDVAAGLKLAAAHEFDLLLSDLGLPDGTGVDLMRTLRREGSTLPGIVISGYGTDQDIARSREAGFAAHLIKPLSSQMLHDAIIGLMG
ncbi:MAG: hybrid sensor histidine kinase/response regulator [Phycisphaerales bacterium]|nr:hybrid sensor histidine kinase/response regulator [Phycisphaerales bacterium]